MEEADAEAIANMLDMEEEVEETIALILDEGEDGESSEAHSRRRPASQVDEFLVASSSSASPGDADKVVVLVDAKEKYSPFTLRRRLARNSEGLGENSIRQRANYKKVPHRRATSFALVEVSEQEDTGCVSEEGSECQEEHDQLSELKLDEAADSPALESVIVSACKLKDRPDDEKPEDVVDPVTESVSSHSPQTKFASKEGYCSHIDAVTGYALAPCPQSGGASKGYASSSSEATSADCHVGASLKCDAITPPLVPRPPQKPPSSRRPVLDKFKMAPSY